MWQLKQVKAYIFWKLQYININYLGGLVEDTLPFRSIVNDVKMTIKISLKLWVNWNSKRLWNYRIINSTFLQFSKTFSLLQMFWIPFLYLIFHQQCSLEFAWWHNFKKMQTTIQASTWDLSGLLCMRNVEWKIKNLNLSLQLRFNLMLVLYLLLSL